MEQLSETYRAAVRRALTGRNASRAALAYGLPKDAIRNVLNGHNPKLSRADDVCRALEFTFLLGRPLNEDESGEDYLPSEAGIQTNREIIRDVWFSELLSRLADQWASTPVSERAGLGLAVASLLDLAGAKSGSKLGRTIECIEWRIFEDRIESNSDQEDAT